MSAIEDILAQIPVGQVADQLGVDPATAEAALATAVPALLNGLSANAQDPSGAASLTEALGQHDPSLLDGDVDLSRFDTQAGDKIVGHVFGDNRAAVVDQLGALPLGGRTGGARIGGSLIAKLLPIIAPIILSYLAKQIFGGGAGSGAGSSSSGSAGGNAGGGAVVSDGSGGSLAPGDAPASTSAPSTDSGAGAGGISETDILGQILGGAAGGSSAGSSSSGSAGGIDLGAILGGLLGAGRR